MIDLYKQVNQIRSKDVTVLLTGESGTGKNIIAIIPARGGRKGIPGKNIKNFEGKPLISHSIEYAKDSNHKNVFNMGIINSSRGFCFPKNANKISTIKDWKKIIQNNLLKTNLDFLK